MIICPSDWNFCQQFHFQQIQINFYHFRWTQAVSQEPRERAGLRAELPGGPLLPSGAPLSPLWTDWGLCPSAVVLTLPSQHLLFSLLTCDWVETEKTFRSFPATSVQPLHIWVRGEKRFYCRTFAKSALEADVWTFCEIARVWTSE